MNRTAGSWRRRRFGAGSTATRESPDARTSSSRHAPSFAFTSSKTRRCTQPSRRGLLVPGGAGVSGRVADNTTNNYATLLASLGRLKEAKSLLRPAIPVARRVLGNSYDITLRMRLIYAMALYKADGATLEDLREAVTTLEDADRIARRVLGGNHPITLSVERALRGSRAALAARETPPGEF